MPSAYRLACDKIEQARAMLDSEIWHDQRSVALISQLIERLLELDVRVMEGPAPTRPRVQDGEHMDRIVSLRTASTNASTRS